MHCVRAVEPTLRIAWGLFFVVAGANKLLCTPVPGLPPRVAGFARFLAVAGIPFPSLNAYAVSLLEVVGGLGVALGRGRIVQVCATTLAGEMAVAFATVGARGLRGTPVRAGTVTYDEPWRVPLELGLLASMLLVVARSIGPDRRGC
jgi:uncharacterized membrane protein YphA (DoxX/SURF4 family)